MVRRRIWFTYRITWAVMCSALLFLTPTASAQSGDNVVVVANQSNADSVEIAERYAKARGLPIDNVIRLKTLPADTPEVISRMLYNRHIQGPIAAWFSRHSAHDRILYIVLTKGIPLRIEGSGGRNGTQASVDSELTLLYRTLTGRAVAPHGQIENPYFAGRAPSDQFHQFTHRNYDIFLVTRLDGFTTSDVMALIDRGISSNRDGRVLLDQRAALDDPGNTWLRAAADRLTTAGFAERVVLDGTSKPLTNEPNVLGYFSWGSSDPSIKTRKLNLGFVPGALAATFVSTDARTFREPPSDWTPGNSGERKAYFAGSPQSLIGDLVREGATGVAGHVAEPYRDAAIRPDLLFPAYLAGFNLAESFYLAMPYLGWQTVILGDPLCAPFRTVGPELADIDPQIDPDTGRSEFFANRRIEILTEKGIKRDALKLFLRGEAALAQGDQNGARHALEAATAMEERLNQAHALLATLHEAASEYDQAIERYRRVLANTPKDSVALNNLAYQLAVHGKQPADALPLAERAHILDTRNPLILDTLGWVHHLLGNRTEALRFLTQAVKGAPAEPDVHVHLAEAYNAAGQVEAAERALAVAIKLSSEIEKRADVQALKTTLADHQK